MEIEPIAAAEANAMLAAGHYLGALAFTPSYCLSTAAHDAVAVFGPPVAVQAFPDGALELRRLWQAENVARPASAFLAATLRWLRRADPAIPFVVSYADPAAGHTGTLYRAANFVFIRESRVTDEWLTPGGKRLSAAQVYRKLKTKSRERVARLRPRWQLVAGAPKLLFAYPMAADIEGLRRHAPARRRLFTEGGGFRNSVYQARFPARTCAHCRRKFLASRSDAKTCSKSCRVMLCRKRRTTITARHHTGSAVT